MMECEESHETFFRRFEFELAGAQPAIPVARTHKIAVALFALFSFLNVMTFVFALAK
jgi:hypothetical protein